MVANVLCGGGDLATIAALADFKHERRWRVWRG
jgi:hypothetical protein